MISARRRRARCGRLAGLVLSLLSVGHLSAETTTTYRYDALGRVLSAQDSNGPAVYYDYDDAGNRVRLSNAAFGEILTATFSASSNAGGFGGLTGTGMRDGDFRSPTSIHATNEENGAWIQADLGAVRNVDTIDLVAASFDGDTQVAANRGKPFTLASLSTVGLFAANAASGVVVDPGATNGAVVEYSRDGAAYTPIATVSGMSVGSCKAVNFNGVSARYIRLRQPAVARMALGEFRVFSSARPQNRSPVTVADAATMTAASITVAPLTNDSDPDGDPITVIGVGAPAHGAAVINDGNSVTYTRTAGYYGDDTFSYTTADCRGATATSMITVSGGETLKAADDTVLAMPDTVNVYDVLRNDTNPGGGHPRIVGKTNGAKGVVAIDVDNVEYDAVTYTPAAGATGADSFTYTISNGAAQDTATVSLVIQPGNHAPVAHDDVVQVPYEGFVDIHPMDNDTDADGDTLMILRHTDGTQGWAEHRGTADSPVIRYGSGAGKTGTDHFTYTIVDGHGATSTATITTTVVGAPNVAPVVVDDDLGVLPINAPKFASVVLNDTDADGDALVLFNFTNGAKGTVTYATATSLIYTPMTGATGPDSFTYTISDQKGNFATGTVRLVLNRLPVAVADTASVDYNTPLQIQVVANDTDVDGDDLLVNAATNGAKGGVALDASGKFLTYFPYAGATGADSFHYTIIDGHGGTATGTVSVTIQPRINTVPALGDDSYAIGYDVTTTLDVLENDVDADGDDLTITAKTNGARGVVTIAADHKSVSYNPNTGTGGLDSFTYTVSDGFGGVSTATVWVVSNLAPVAVADTLSAVHSTATSANVLANDTDADGDSLVITSKTNGAKGVVTIAPDGLTLSYTSNTGATGTDSFTYTISDGQGATATATVSVTITNTKPIANNDDMGVIAYDKTTDVNVLVNDGDPDGDTLTITAKTNGLKGVVTINPGGQSVSYNPNLTSGTDSFTYTISDGFGGTAIGTVFVTILPNNNPVANPDTVLVPFFTPTLIDVLANDSDPDGDVLTIPFRSNGTKGTTSVSGSQILYTPNAGASGADSFSYRISDGKGATAQTTVSVTISPSTTTPPSAAPDSQVVRAGVASVISVLANDSGLSALTIISRTNGAKGTVTIAADGQTLTYTGAAGSTGSDSFTYTIRDVAGAAATATVTVAFNRYPVAVLDNVITAFGAGVTTAMDVLANDSDPDGDPLTITSTGTPTKGTVAIDAGGQGLTYTRTVDDGVTDSFTYTISDGRGGTATITVKVTPNRPPVAVDDERSAPFKPSFAVGLNPLVNDSDPDGDTLTVISFTQPSHGGVWEQGIAHAFFYLPSGNFIGTDSFTYTISDQKGGVATATYYVTILPPPGNHAPVAVDDNVTVAPGFAKQLNVLANDSDEDGNPFTITDKTDGQKGMVTINSGGASLTYTPNPGELGSDSFTYTIDDARGGTATATVFVMIYNAPPNAVEDTLVASSGQAWPLRVLLNDSDPDGNTLTIDSATDGAKGTVSIAPGSAGSNGIPYLIYRSPVGANGTDTISYTVSDGVGGTATATVHVVVDRRPTGGYDTISIPFGGTPTPLYVLANDSDPDGDALHVLLAKTPVMTTGKGRVEVDPSGQYLIYTRTVFDSLDDGFSYGATDVWGLSSTVYVKIKVQ